MKIALAIHGNLRTFLMPLRENPSVRVCDVLLKNIIHPNNPDIFICTDNNDFYYNNSVNYTNNLIEISNSDPFRIHHNINFLNKDISENIIRTELNKILSNIKNISILDYYNAEDDEKYNILATSNLKGVSPALLIQQYRKLKILSNMITEYELNNNFKYDIIMKVRFDSMYRDNPLHLQTYDITNNNLFVPGLKGNLAFDWYAFAKRNIMMDYINLYDKLGFTINDPQWINECYACGLPTGHKGIVPNDNKCIKCGNNNNYHQADVTLSSEHHIYRHFTENNINIIGANYFVWIYRYLKDNNISINDILQNNKVKLKDGMFINHTTTPNEITKVKL